MTASHIKLGLGTVQFGLKYGVANKTGQTPVAEVSEILKAAIDNNVSLIDTASAYGNAEEVLGQFDLKSFRVVSKFMPDECLNLELSIRQSLEKLKIDRLYGYLAHRPLSVLEHNYWQELNLLKEKGLVRKIGYSLNEPSELDILLDRGYLPDLIQVPYNYFDRRFEQQMIALKNKGCEIHTRSTFLQGLFFIKADDLSSFFNEVKPTLKKIQKDHSSIEGLLLNYVLKKEFIDHVIIGVDNKSQFLQNINSLSDSEELKDLDFNFSDKILMPMYWPKNS